MDILAVTKAKRITANTSFWILVIESKNSSVAPIEGLPQLLTYAYKSLQYQTSVWGLVTNGQYYQFVYIKQSDVLIYQLMPVLNFMESQRAIDLLQVMKAICQL